MGLETIEDYLADALKQMLDISRRIPGCPDSTCLVCQENSAALTAAKQALEMYDSET